MPRTSRFSRVVCLVASLGLYASDVGAEPPAIAELNWIHPGADPVAILTTRPRECRAAADDAELSRWSRLGRVAFRSPVLLGGIAARVGIRCDSCHRNGHDNASFHFPGVSGEAGTADVTGSVFSTHREDGISNPVPIPTLVDASDSPPFGTIRPVSDLKGFILAAVVDEFQGAQPPSPVIDGLVQYIESLRSAACSGPIEQTQSFDRDAAEALETFDVMMEWSKHDDREVRRFVLLSLRSLLERIYRRFPESVSRRDDLVRLSRLLFDMNTRSEHEDFPPPASIVTPDREYIAAVLRALRMDADRSFYEAEVLRRALDSRP